MTDSWEYPAKPDRATHELGVVDGDTIDLQADLGMNTYRRFTLRLEGIDTAEIYGPYADEAGTEHARFVRDWIETAVQIGGEWPLYVETLESTGKYGRYIGTVERTYDGQQLADALVEAFGAEVRA